MDISVFVGGIADAPAEAICTSTNPRLSLMMGTGASVRERGGWDVMRACQTIAGAGRLAAGSAHATTAGAMPCKTLIHCVASDPNHLTSAPIVAACVRNALARADEAGCRSVAMPLFGTGHARMKFDQALTAMRDALHGATTNVEQVVIVVHDASRAADVKRAIASRE